jgi:hypothetical protein
MIELLLTTTLEIGRILRHALLALMLFLRASSGETAPLDTPDPVKAMNYAGTAVGQLLVEQAATVANNVLGSRSRFRLVGSWQPAPAHISQDNLIRIYLVAPKEGDNFSIMVPFDCNCVFLQPRIFQASLSAYSDASKEMLKVDEQYAMAFMLLHEIGHVEHGDFARYQDIKGKHDYNLDESAQKRIESSADEFAAQTLTAAANDKANFNGWMAAMNVELALTNMSWNLSVIRLLDNFGASVLCSKFVFADDGTTHPNYELRVLTVNDLISHTPTSGELLKNFEACRTRAPVPPIFKQQ